MLRTTRKNGIKEQYPVWQKLNSCSFRCGICSMWYDMRVLTGLGSLALTAFLTVAPVTS